MLEVLSVDSIFVGERQRRDAADQHVVDLRKDIETDGLIHSIAVDENTNLVVGGCRLQAVKGIVVPYRYGTQMIQPGFIPAVRIKEGDTRVLFRIELNENLRRKNLSPADEARAVSKLHEMFKESNPGQTRAETGAALDVIRGEPVRNPDAQTKEVTDALIINAFADDPDVKKAATRREAVRIAKKKLEQEFLGGLGALESVKQKGSENFYLLEGSCIDLFPKIPDGFFNGIVTDPPYGMGADSFGEQSTATGHQYTDTPETAIPVIRTILSDGFRVCKPDAHLYMFCDIRVWPMLRDYAAECGWLPFATPLIWHKPGLGHAPQPGYFGRRYECILFAQKGGRKLSKSASDVLVCPSVKDKMYAAQKPVELLVEILNLSFYPGEHILDPCVGSGSLYRAGRLAKMRVTGIELNPVAIGLSRAAINGTV